MVRRLGVFPRLLRSTLLLTSSPILISSEWEKGTRDSASWIDLSQLVAKTNHNVTKLSLLINSHSDRPHPGRLIWLIEWRRGNVQYSMMMTKSLPPVIWPHPRSCRLIDITRPWFQSFPWLCHLLLYGNYSVIGMSWAYISIYIYPVFIWLTNKYICRFILVSILSSIVSLVLP